MHDSVHVKNFAPAMATPISKKGACGTKCFISSDNKRQILFKNIIDFIYFGKIYYVKPERLHYFSKWNK